MGHFDNLFSRLVPITVLLASLSGSLHCVAMCGGLIAATTSGDRSRWRWVQYQCGRLTGYLVLGGVAGFLGKYLLLSERASGVLKNNIAIFSGLLMAFYFVMVGVFVFRQRPLHGHGLWLGLWRVTGWAFFQKTNRKIDRFVQRLYERGKDQVFFLGMLSGILPCGWLHTFVVGALATGGALAGMSYLFLFWLGTLPALAGVGILSQWVRKKWSRPAAIVAGVLLIILGFATLAFKVWPLLIIGNGRAQSSHSLNSGGHCH